MEILSRRQKKRKSASKFDPNIANDLEIRTLGASQAPVRQPSSIHSQQECETNTCDDLKFFDNSRANLQMQGDNVPLSRSIVTPRHQFTGTLSMTDWTELREKLKDPRCVLLFSSD